MYLKDVGRIQGLLAVYFFVLLVQTLLERELRRAMAKDGLESLPLYPEGRPMHAAHDLPRSRNPRVGSAARASQTEPGGCRVPSHRVTPLQRQIIQLMGMSPTDYGL